MEEQRVQVEFIRRAFEQEFGRFVDLSSDGVGLADAEAMLREVS